MKRADRLARHFIRAFNLRAVYLAEDHSGRAVVGFSQEPQKRMRDLSGRIRGGLEPRGVWWCASTKEATELLEACPAGATVEEATMIIHRAAKAAGIGLTADEAVQARALTVVLQLGEQVEAMKARGQLKHVNAAYRKAREEHAARGERFINYGDFLDRYKIRMLYGVAQAARSQ